MSLLSAESGTNWAGSRGRIQGEASPTKIIYGHGAVEMKLGRTVDTATAGRVYFGRCGE